MRKVHPYIFTVSTLIKKNLWVIIIFPILLISMEDQLKFSSDYDNTISRLLRIRFAADTKRDEIEKRKNDQRELINKRVKESLNLDEPMPDSSDESPLHIVVADFYDQGILTKQLLQAGANPNVCDSSYETPLHVACNHLSIANIQVLLKHNANPNAQDKTFETPLHKICAQERHHPAQIIAAKILLSYGAVLQKNHYGYAPLECIRSNIELRKIIDRIYKHKKPAYFFLLMGKGLYPSPFKQLPMDCVRSIIDSIYPNYPSWPKEPLNCRNPLSFLTNHQE